MYNKCKEILLKEFELIQYAAVLHKNVQDAVTNREWTDFDSLFMTINSMESEFTALEEERQRLFFALESSNKQIVSPELLDAKGRFYAMTAQLPAEQRNELTEIYRNMKIEALKLKMTNEALQSYLSGMNETLSDFFSVAFPERGGSTYTPDGKHHSRDMKSMVLNHSF